MFLREDILMFEDEKKKCTGAGAKLESTVNSLEKLIVPSAIVIAVVGALACLLAKNLGGILNCLVTAFIYAIALNVAVLILRYLADISINSEVSARVTASEHEAKVAALTSYNTKAEESVDEEPVSGSPFAPKKSVSKPAAKKPVNNAFVSNVKEEAKAEVKEEVEEVKPEPEVKEEPVAAFKPVEEKPAVKPIAKPVEEKPVAKVEKKEEPKTTRPSAPKASERASSKKDEPSILKSSLSSGGGDKLPGSGSDKDRPVPTTLNKTFVPIGGPAPVASESNAAPSPFKPLAGATPKTKTIEKEETSSAPSPFKPVAKAPAKETAKEPAKEEKSEEVSPLANKTFTPSPFAPSPAANNLEPAPSPFKPLASKAAPTKAAAAPEKESAADAAMAKLNKLHKCPACDVMINTNPCPRCGHEILLKDLLAENKPAASATAADSKSSINKLHKCANCGRIAKQSPCEHCGS